MAPTPSSDSAATMDSADRKRDPNDFVPSPTTEEQIFGSHALLPVLLEIKGLIEAVEEQARTLLGAARLMDLASFVLLALAVLLLLGSAEPRAMMPPAAVLTALVLTAFRHLFGLERRGLEQRLLAQSARAERMAMLEEASRTGEDRIDHSRALRDYVQRVRPLLLRAEVPGG